MLSPFFDALRCASRCPRAPPSIHGALPLALTRAYAAAVFRLRRDADVAVIPPLRYTLILLLLQIYSRTAPQNAQMRRDAYAQHIGGGDILRFSLSSADILRTLKVCRHHQRVQLPTSPHATESSTADDDIILFFFFFSKCLTPPRGRVTTNIEKVENVAAHVFTCPSHVSRFLYQFTKMREGSMKAPVLRQYARTRQCRVVLTA